MSFIFFNASATPEVVPSSPPPPPPYRGPALSKPRPNLRHNFFVAALITAVPFALVHWPLAFLGNVTVGSAAVALAAYLALGIIFRPMLAVFLRGTHDSVLLVALLHSVFNRTNNRSEERRVGKE